MYLGFLHSGQALDVALPFPRFGHLIRSDSNSYLSVVVVEILRRRPRIPWKRGARDGRGNDGQDLTMSDFVFWTA